MQELGAERSFAYTQGCLVRDLQNNDHVTLTPNA